MSNHVETRLGTLKLTKQPIAQLEEFGVSIQVINKLEDKYGLVWMSQLDTISVLDVARLGVSYSVELMEGLRRYVDGDRRKSEEQTEWEQMSRSRPKPKLRNSPKAHPDLL